MDGDTLGLGVLADLRIEAGFAMSSQAHVGSTISADDNLGSRCPLSGHTNCSQHARAEGGASSSSEVIHSLLKLCPGLVERLGELG
jgi:hypothetical protein